MLAVMLALVPAARAATNGFVLPSFRGEASTTYSGWENFTVGVGEPGNAGDLPDSDNAARLYQTAPGAMVLSSGNIYNGEGQSLFDLRYTGDDLINRVTLQVRTLGTELDYDSVQLLAATATGPQTLGATRMELDREMFGPPPPAPGSGSAVSSLWSWDLAGLGADYFVISFAAAEVNLSLDSATLDVQLIPEPAPSILLLAGCAVLVASRRRPARRACAPCS
jgi:hypothetical protein